MSEGHPEPLEPCADPAYQGNSAKYHTGKPCIEVGCREPAGTAWGPYWRRKHNAERLQRISGQLASIVDSFETEGEATP